MVAGVPLPYRTGNGQCGVKKTPPRALASASARAAFFFFFPFFWGQPGAFSYSLKLLMGVFMAQSTGVSN